MTSVGMCSVTELIEAAKIKAKQDDQRLGQAAFNLLVESEDSYMRDLAEMVRTTRADPFYAQNEAEPEFRSFKKFISQYLDA